MIVVTGGAGFIGSNLINELITKNTKALFLVTIILFFIGQILWAYHGKFSNDFAVLIFACITGILYIYLIYAKLKYG